MELITYLGSGLRMFSKGRNSRIKGIKTGRQHEFLSGLEKNYYYYILKFAGEVRDISEQFTLQPLEDTGSSIANELRIIHPRNPITESILL